jgi:hypothetical protein
VVPIVLFPELVFQLPQLVAVAVQYWVALILRPQLVALVVVAQAEDHMLLLPMVRREHPGREPVVATVELDILLMPILVLSAAAAVAAEHLRQAPMGQTVRR